MKKKKYISGKKREEKELKMQTDMLIAFYKNNLDIFAERELGIKLTWFQRKMLKMVQKGIRKNEM